VAIAVKVAVAIVHMVLIKKQEPIKSKEFSNSSDQLQNQLTLKYG
jgi:hypothetical protein